MKWSSRGCDFRTTSNRGMENHVKSCDRKRSRKGSESHPRTQEAAHGDALIPKGLEEVHPAYHAVILRQLPKPAVFPRI